MNTQTKCDKCGHHDRKRNMEKHGDVYHCGDCRTHDKETNDEWFDRKFEGCSCIECDRALTSKNAEMCGECDMLYCKECWTGNCPHCSDEEEDYCNGCDRDVPSKTMFNHDDINLCPECNTKKPELIPEGCECERCVKV